MSDYLLHINMKNVCEDEITLLFFKTHFPSFKFDHSEWNSFYLIITEQEYLYLTLSFRTNWITLNDNTKILYIFGIDINDFIDITAKLR